MKKPAKKAAKSKPKTKRSPEPDVNQLAHEQIRRLTEDHSEPIPALVILPKPSESEISRVMAELGRRGGKIGGKRRAASMTPERRREIALQAARKRWDE